jgi:hypothetical protein
MLESYALAFLRKYRHLDQVVGIASEPINQTDRRGSSEDLMWVQPGEWTPSLLEERKKLFNIVQEGKYKEYAVHGSEFPKVQQLGLPLIG